MPLQKLTANWRFCFCIESKIKDGTELKMRWWPQAARPASCCSHTWKLNWSWPSAAWANPFATSGTTTSPLVGQIYVSLHQTWQTIHVCTDIQICIYIYTYIYKYIYICRSYYLHIYIYIIVYIYLGDNLPNLDTSNLAVLIASVQEPRGKTVAKLCCVYRLKLISSLGM